MPHVSLPRFQLELQERLGAFWERALTTFIDFGPNLSPQVLEVLCAAVEQNKVEAVLGVLEAHYASILQGHRRNRGFVTYLEINPTQEMFSGIRQQILSLPVQC